MLITRYAIMCLKKLIININIFSLLQKLTLLKYKFVVHLIMCKFICY